MILASELRIGNKFKGVGGTQTVLSLEENTDRGKCKYSSEEHRLMYSHLILCNENGNQYKPFEVDPIELTEEILFNCGFETDYICFYKDDFTIGNFARGVLIWLPTGSLSSSEKGVILKYVHQLQNLYFVLTGEELTWPT